MHRFIISVFFCLFFITIRAVSEIAYTFKPVFSGSKPHLQILLSCKTAHTRRTEIQIPDCNGGETKLFNQIRSIRVVAGREVTRNTRHLVISHEPGAVISIAFDLQQDWPDAQFKRFRAQMQKDFMRFSGACALLKPLYYAPTCAIACHFDLPADWFACSSFGSGKHQYYTGKPDILTNSFFALGSRSTTRLHELSIVSGAGNAGANGSMGGSQKLIVLLRGKFTFTDQDFCTQLHRLIHYQRSFFNDHDFPVFTVSLIQLMGEQQAHGWKIGGACYANIFDAFCSPNTPLHDVLMLSAHEHLHSWNGCKIKTSHDELLYWFSEGFTDYYTQITAFRAGIISQAQFINNCNEQLAGYYISPLKNAPNTHIKKDFWHDRTVNRLPYQRGFAFALLLNSKIRHATTGRHSLDDLMKDLLPWSRSIDFRERFSVQILDRLVRRYLPAGILNEIEKYIERGETIPFVPDAFGSLARFATAQLGIFDLGFDTAQLTTGVMPTVKPESNAYKAGLRPGQQVRRWTLWDNPHKECSITLYDQRVIKFFPQGPPFITVPNYYL